MSTGNHSNSSPKWFGVITLFPEMLASLKLGIIGRALKNQLIEIHAWNPRDFTEDKHQSVDDKPYGGGPGMVMRAAPLAAAVNCAKAAAPSKPHVIYLSPQGKTFKQESAKKLLSHAAILFIAGRYEGIDQRFIDQEVDEEWSIGDYVVSGGELPALIMIDAMTRLIPGVVGDEDSVTFDSHYQGLLKYPQYTRPEHYQGMSVPEILLSGNHQRIATWRKEQALIRTLTRRPDLLIRLNQQEKSEFRGGASRKTARRSRKIVKLCIKLPN